MIKFTMLNDREISSYTSVSHRNIDRQLKYLRKNIHQLFTDVKVFFSLLKKPNLKIYKN